MYNLKVDSRQGIQGESAEHIHRAFYMCRSTGAKSAVKSNKWLGVLAPLTVPSISYPYRVY